MRIIPFSLYDPDNVEFIEKGSALTHAHMRSKIACVIYTFILNNLLQTKDISSVSAAIEKAKNLYSGSSEWEYYEDLLKVANRDRTSIKSGGYVVDTLYAALWCLMTTDSYKDCVLKAVNLGSDTDTVAAVAGGLAGALYGYESIPANWLEKLKKREYIESLCEKAYSVWSAK